MLIKILIANRGEVAIHIARTASELGIVTVAVYSPDDTQSLDIEYCDERAKLPCAGMSAYLYIQSFINVALKTKCDSLDSVYGFMNGAPLNVK